MTDRKLEIILAAKDMTDKAFDSVVGRMQGLEKRIFSLHSAAALLAGATGLGYVIKRNLEAVTEMGRLAAMAGVNVDAFQELSYAAGQYNINQDALTDGLKELQLRADEFVVTGAGPAAEAFQRLGYEQSELNRRLSDAPALLQDVISRMEGLDQAAKIRISDELFGGQGGEQFVAMINKGADALAGLREEARALGIVIDQDMVEASDEANRSINALTTVLKLNFQSVIADLAPDIADVTQKMAEWVKQNDELIKQKVDESIDAVGTAINGIVKVYNSLPDGVVGAAGVGIAGRIIFGGPAGGALAAIAIVNEGMKAFDLNIGSIVDKYDRYKEAFDNIWGVVTGRLDASTGAPKRLEDWDVGEWETPTTTRNPVMPTVEVVASRPTTNTRTTTSGTQIKQTAEWLKDVDRLAKEAQDSLSDMSEPQNAWAILQGQLENVDELLERMNAPLIKFREESNQLYTGFATGDIKSELDDWYAEHDEAISRLQGLHDEKNQYMIDMSERTAEAMEQNFSDFFFDTMTGEFDSLSDYLDGVLNSMARATSDILGQIWKELLFGAEGSGGGWLSGIGGWISSLFEAGTGTTTATALTATPIPAAHGRIFPDGIIDRPVMWAAGGALNIAGEAGSEAIMPLTRTPSGDLGVYATGGGGSQPVTVNLTIQAVDASSFADLAKRNPGAITAPLLEAMQHGDRGLINTMKGALRG